MRALQSVGERTTRGDRKARFGPAWCKQAGPFHFSLTFSDNFSDKAGPICRKSSTPGRIRTCNPRFRRPMRYPIAPRTHLTPKKYAIRPRFATLPPDGFSISSTKYSSTASQRPATTRNDPQRPATTRNDPQRPATAGNDPQRPETTRSTASRCPAPWTLMNPCGKSSRNRRVLPQLDGWPDRRRKMHRWRESGCRKEIGVIFSAAT